MIKIESNIPIPRNKSGREMKYPFKLMEVGDSFLVPPGSDNKVRICAHASRKQTGYNYTVRKMEDGTYRCWRIS